MLIKKSAAPFFAILFFILNACGHEKEITQECNLENLPINREESCPSYKDEDAKLNSAYKGLVGLLSAGDKLVLRKAQKEWISFRDSTCQAVMENSSEVCPNSSCIDLNHDRCIIKLTKNRASELISFGRDINKAKSVNFEFSKNN